MHSENNTKADCYTLVGGLSAVLIVFALFLIALGSIKTGSVFGAIAIIILATAFIISFIKERGRDAK